MEPLLIGYFPGYPIKQPEWLEAPGVEEVCSANRAHIHLPENWYHQQRHNALMHFDSEEIAWTVLQDDVLLTLVSDDTLDPPWHVGILRLSPKDFDLYAYKVLPVRLVEGHHEELQLTPPKAAPLPRGYERLGYDVVSWSGTGDFGCCPLSCNGDARTQPVNRYCLLDQRMQALHLARVYSEGNWEPGPHYCGRKDPGPYCVVEVWRKCKPFAEPKRSGDPFEWSPDLLRNLVQQKLANGGVYE